MKTYKFWETLDFKKFPNGTRFIDNEYEPWQIVSDDKENSYLVSENTNRTITGTLENVKKEFTILPYPGSFEEILKIVLINPEIKVTVEHELVDIEQPKTLELLINSLSLQLNSLDLAAVLLNGKWSVI